MRWAGRRVAVYAHGAPTDMRKGFDSLCGMVTERLARNPLSGDVFLFVSRDRIRAKVLHFDGTGPLPVREAPGARALRGAVAGRGGRPDDAHRQRARSLSRWQRAGRSDAAHAARAHALFACLGSSVMIKCAASWCRSRKNATSRRSGRSVSSSSARISGSSPRISS